MRHKPDGPFRRIGWRHQLAQRIKHLLELRPRIAAKGVVRHGQRFRLVLQFGQLLGQVLVGNEGQIPIVSPLLRGKLQSNLYAGVAHYVLLFQ